MPLPYFYATTNIGLKRENNEDTIVSKPGDNLWIVADGMGGHASGEVASEIAGKTIAENVNQGKPLSIAIQSAHKAILDAAESGIGHFGMGSTVVALKSSSNSYQIAWVGDSRAYLWSDDEEGPLFTQLTVDHSYVQMLYESGAISQEEMLTHPEKNIITQCLGSVDIDQVRVDLIDREWQRNDLILLCSDGLTDAVDNQSICNILAKGKEISETAQELIQAALSRGGRDNISVILIAKPPSGIRRMLGSLLPN